MYAPRDDDGSAPAGPAPASPAPQILLRPQPGPDSGVALPQRLRRRSSRCLQPPTPGAGLRRFRPRRRYASGVPAGQRFGGTEYALHRERGTERRGGCASVSPLRVKWDPAVLRLTDITPGDLLSRNGGAVSSIKDVRNDAGEATLNVSRAAGAGSLGIRTGGDPEFRGRGAREGFRDGHRDGLEELRSCKRCRWRWAPFRWRYSRNR